MKILIIGGSGSAGAELIAYYERKKNVSILNYDWEPPLNPKHAKYWWQGDIIHLQKLQAVKARFKPERVIDFTNRLGQKEDISAKRENIKALIRGSAILKSSTSLPSPRQAIPPSSHDGQEKPLPILRALRSLESSSGSKKETGDNPERKILGEKEAGLPNFSPIETSVLRKTSDFTDTHSYKQGFIAFQTSFRTHLLSSPLQKDPCLTMESSAYFLQHAICY